MPCAKIWIHLVWSTKNREPYLAGEIRRQVLQHIRENTRGKGIHLDAINGTADHVHCLVSLGTDQTIEKVVQLIKGESSFWINKNNLCKTKFGWQDEYFAASVSEAVVESVRKYIAEQEEHHRTKSYAEEFAEFMSRAGLEKPLG